MSYQTPVNIPDSVQPLSVPDYDNPPSQLDVFVAGEIDNVTAPLLQRIHELETQIMELEKSAHEKSETKNILANMKEVCAPMRRADLWPPKSP